MDLKGPLTVPVCLRSNGEAEGWGLGERQEGVKGVSGLAFALWWLPLSLPCQSF